ncbi:MAG: SIR2 family protein [Oscillospiraceae bacterium]|nr:SIR2 family protein [Oscillospiraceae bacterium]
MSIYIQNEALFKDKLKKGICVFAGAGFSTLVSPSGKKLPVGEELCKEVISHFRLDLSEEYGLSYISEFCPESEYQSFLREYFTVSDYAPLYNVLNKVNLKAFITTNIDNIIRMVTENGNRYYLKNIREYGATIGGPNELLYIPLHGDVTSLSSKLYFGKFELSDVDLVNGDLFSQMRGVLSTSPVLFWGYSFNDSGVLKIVKKIIESNPSNIWVQVRPEDTQNKKLFEGKGCNIISSDTENLLQWIDNNCIYTHDLEGIPINDKALQKYKLPTITDIPIVPSEDFYRKGITEWYPIIQGIPYERKAVTKAENNALENKNVIISGCHFSGKTTILMQLARKVDSINKLYVQGITKEEASFIVKQTKGQAAWIFFNDCCSDIDAFLVFAKSANIKVVGATDDYLLETVRHILSSAVSYKVVNCSEINEVEAQRMYNKLPEGLKEPSFKYTTQPDEKYSMFEYISSNIQGAYTEKHIASIFREIKKQSQDLFDVVAMASYMSRNNSAISYQNVAHLLGINVYPDALNLVVQAKEYLRQYNLSLCDETEYQDYFILRSKVFNYCAHEILIKEYRNEYGKLIKWVVTQEPRYSILRYDIFRRKAFDSELFRKVFSYKEATSIYNFLYERDGNPYTLQQLALCQSSFGDFQNAFASIDLAVSKQPRNFSFRNSQAIILFESNHKNHVPDSVKYMKQAMRILEQCYANDKRKLYHAQKFSDFALVLSDEYEIDDYLEMALKWLIEMTDNDESESRRSRRLKERLRNKLSII